MGEKKKMVLSMKEKKKPILVSVVLFVIICIIGTLCVISDFNKYGI